MMTTPVFAFWHPPHEEPPCPWFGVMINGEWGTPTDPYMFYEPYDHFCNSVTVEVFICNVTDLYGYEFKLGWDTAHFSLKSWTVEMTWGADTVVVKPDASYKGAYMYLQVVTAKHPALGVTGPAFKLATLVFHIDNDVCWNQAPFIDGWFWVQDYKASNSCSQPLEPQLCAPINAYWKWVPCQPVVDMEPAIDEDTGLGEVNWKVGDKWTLTLTVENITKVSDVHLWVDWYGYHHTLGEDFYTVLLCTTKADVVINNDLFPSAKMTAAPTITVHSPLCNQRYTSAAAVSGYVGIEFVMKSGYLVNLTDNIGSWIAKITFTKCDPWYCGAQPFYTPKDDHDWWLENATTDIFYDHGSYFSVMCPTLDYQWFYGGVKVYNTNYMFAPVPGDLTGDGKVDIDDLTIEIGYYGLDWSTWTGYYYDLNKSHLIDIYDIVIVAKNYGRDAPNLDP